MTRCPGCGMLQPRQPFSRGTQGDAEPCALCLDGTPVQAEFFRHPRVALFAQHRHNLGCPFCVPPLWYPHRLPRPAHCGRANTQQSRDTAVCILTEFGDHLRRPTLLRICRYPRDLICRYPQFMPLADDCGPANSHSYPSPAPWAYRIRRAAGRAALVSMSLWRYSCNFLTILLRRSVAILPGELNGKVQRKGGRSHIRA